MSDSDYKGSNDRMISESRIKKGEEVNGPGLFALKSQHFCASEKGHTVMRPVAHQCRRGGEVGGGAGANYAGSGVRKGAPGPPMSHTCLSFS